MLARSNVKAALMGVDSTSDGCWKACHRVMLAMIKKLSLIDHGGSQDDLF